MGQMFRRLLEMHGLDAVTIAKDAGVDLAVIPAPGERIEVDKIDAMLRLAIPLIRDPAFVAEARKLSLSANHAGADEVRATVEQAMTMLDKAGLAEVRQIALERYYQ